MGLIAGVFYREFTKFYKYSANNHLSKLHVVNKAALEGLSGLGHIVLAIGIVWMVVKIFQNESNITLRSIKE